MENKAQGISVTVINVHFDVYFTVFVGVRLNIYELERWGERERCASDWIRGSAEETARERESEGERERTRGHECSLHISPAARNYSKLNSAGLEQGAVKREDGKDAENEENPALHSLGK